MESPLHQSFPPKELETITIEVPGKPLCNVKIMFEHRLYKIPEYYANIWFDYIRRDPLQFRKLMQFQELVQFQELMRKSSN
jgi:hypothetical protein